MIDRFGRNITYMRLSVTEQCNLRCRYCMPADACFREDALSDEEILRAVRAAASLGVSKLRITGGEPLVRRGIVELCGALAAVPGIEELCLTTNGLALPRLAAPLREAGVRRVNMSLDTLDAEKYRALTRGGSLELALRGLDAALEAGFEKLKINAVLIGGVNDDEIPALAGLTQRYPLDVRFIELMPMVDGGFGPEAYLPASVVLEKLPEAAPLVPDGGVARLYRLPGAKGMIGLIRPVSSHFCASCNRIRLTADGKLKPCLHSAAELSIKGLDDAQLIRQFEKAILDKPRWHGELSATEHSQAGRSMNQIGG
jgi:cyclic pyranopterin phosphate synthase